MSNNNPPPDDSADSWPQRERYVPEEQQHDSGEWSPAPAPPTSSVAVPVAAGLAMKRREPVVVWLLALITFGIYGLVWYYKIHREMADFDRRRAIPVAGPVLVLIFLGWTVIAPLISYYNTGKRIANSQRAAGLRPTCSGGLGTVLMLIFAVGYIYYQSELNKVVEVYPGAPEGAQVPLFV